MPIRRENWNGMLKLFIMILPAKKKLSMYRIVVNDRCYKTLAEVLMGRSHKRRLFTNQTIVSFSLMNLQLYV